MSRGDALAATAVTSMAAVTMTMRAESAAAETAIADAATFPPSPVRSGPAVRTAVVRPDKTHRYRADGRRAHQRQHHAPRTFHGTTCAEKDLSGFSHANPRVASESGSFHGIVQREGSTAAGKMRREGVRERTEAAARHAGTGTRRRSAGRRFVRRGISAIEAVAR